ncbi:hypothetical protein QFC20_002135 [Naganishia adeliensis]|uniref:Uncharacterized protein n=1 Tax=Naganishia adeliensis TaxID=92952 RepID=A0ACC2WMD7_9TREE|nr:hypothetical protein QFC20_002135 [Naganishia adeliensis]
MMVSPELSAPMKPVSSAPPAIPPRARGRPPPPPQPVSVSTEPRSGSEVVGEVDQGRSESTPALSVTPQPNSTAITSAPASSIQDVPASAELRGESGNLGNGSEGTVSLQPESSVTPQPDSTVATTSSNTTTSDQSDTAEAQRGPETLGESKEVRLLSQPEASASLQPDSTAATTPATTTYSDPPITEEPQGSSENVGTGNVGRLPRPESSVTQPDSTAVSTPPIATASEQPVGNENGGSSPPVDSARVPLPPRASSSFSSHSASSARQSLPSNGGDTLCSASTSGTFGLAVGTPEGKSHPSRVDVEQDVETKLHTSRLGVEDDMETFGRKMSYALQVDAPLSQGFTTPNTITRSTFSSPTLGPDSRRASRNDDSESSTRWTPPGRISRPSGVSPSHARSPSQPSPERMHSPRMSSTSSYMTKRQQQAHDLRSEVDEENRKRRERRTVVVKDGYKIVDGVRAKASSSGVYTPVTFQATSSGEKSPYTSSVYTPATLSPSSTPGLATPNGFSGPSNLPSATSPGYVRASHSRASLPSPGLLSPSLSSFTSPHSPDAPPSAGGSFRSRPFLPAALTRKQLGMSGGDAHPGGLVTSAITGMRSLSMGIESWRKHSVTGSAGGSSSALGTEYDELLRREEAARTSGPGQDEYKRNASVSAMDLPEPRSPRRQSEPNQQLQELYSMGIPVRNLDAEYAPSGKPSTMGGKNVKGLRLPLSDMHAASIPTSTIAPSRDSPASNTDADSPGYSGLLSPAFISGNGNDSSSPIASPPVPLASPLSMGAASKGTRRKPVPATFATTLGRVASTAPVAVESPRRISAEVEQ